MLNPKHQRYANRLQALVAEGQVVATLERPSTIGPFFQNEDTIKVQSWLTKVRNILEMVFGREGPHFRQFEDILPQGGMRFVSHSHDVYPIIGVLTGALDDLQHGYLFGQETLVAGEVLDSILEQSRQLLGSSYKDPAAVLARVVLEDALRRIGRNVGIEGDLKSSSINDELKKIGRYPQPQWRFVQAWLDIGNAAAHGKFNEYSEKEVSEMIEGVERFLTTELCS